jgi:hypothetical protein
LANTPSAGEWRTFEVATKIELLKPNGISHIWLPAPLMHNTPYQKTLSTRFEARGGVARLSQDKQSALGIVSATYAANVMPMRRWYISCIRRPKPQRDVAIPSIRKVLNMKSR